MKRTLLYAALVLSGAIAGCEKTEKLSMTGIYKLDKQMISGGGSDSTYFRTQIKIYTAHQFIYAGMTADSSVGFGVGNYKQDSTKRLIENEFYSSYRLDTSRAFHLIITTTEDGFSQKIPSIAIIKGVKYDMTEDYSKIPSGDSSKLNGLWKMNKSIAVNGKDTLKKQVTQYKIFYGGHFLFAGRYLVANTANKFRNDFGYGSFSLSGNDLTEQDTLSNDPGLLKQKFNIKIQFSGDNQYTQVISDPQSKAQSIETYVRLK